MNGDVLIPTDVPVNPLSLPTITFGAWVKITQSASENVEPM